MIIGLLLVVCLLLWRIAQRQDARPDPNHEFFIVETHSAYGEPDTKSSSWDVHGEFASIRPPLDEYSAGRENIERFVGDNEVLYSTKEIGLIAKREFVVFRSYEAASDFFARESLAGPYDAAVKRDILWKAEAADVIGAFSIAAAGRELQFIRASDTKVSSVQSYRRNV